MIINKKSGNNKKRTLLIILELKYLTVISDNIIKIIPMPKIIFLNILKLKLSFDLKTKSEEINAIKGI